ncbi:hypothetical protein TRVL_08368 [Trypanosoma vivax]|nr:hypothetical protein TRVL_08368 [Trypanosoma vivax]
MFLWAKGSTGEAKACNEHVLGRNGLQTRFETRWEKGGEGELFLPMETDGVKGVIALMVRSAGLVTRAVKHVGPLLNNGKVQEHMLGRGGAESGETSQDEWAPLPKIPENLETTVPGKIPCFTGLANIGQG